MPIGSYLAIENNISTFEGADGYFAMMIAILVGVFGLMIGAIIMQVVIGWLERKSKR